MFSNAHLSRCSLHVAPNRKSVLLTVTLAAGLTLIDQSLQLRLNDADKRYLCTLWDLHNNDILHH